MRFSLIAALAVGFVAPPLSRTSVLLVSVGDAKSGAFIADAQVRIPSLSRVARTKWDGEARFDDLREGRYRIQVRAIGYAPGDIDLEVKGDTASLHFELEKITPTLDTIRVTATRGERNLDEFETRRRQNLGRFVTDSTLQAEHAKGLQLILISHIPGLKVVGRGVKAMEPQVTGKRSGDGCPVLIYVDGFKYREPDPTTRDTQVDDLGAINFDEVAAVEAHSLSTVPAQYKTLGDYCKVVLIWTKR